MTAGSVLVPQVIPLRVPTPGKAKHEIDTTTLVEIKSDTPNVSIYYTIDGSKPQLFRGVGYRDHNTFKYKGPITLPEGKITVKALAVTKDYRESTIVTKVFVVEWIAPNVHVPDEDNDENFLKDLSGQEMENGLSDLKQRNKEVKGENEVSWNGVAQEFKGLLKEKSSLLSHLSRPHLLNNYSSDKEESVSSTLMPQSQMGLCLKCHTTVPVNTPTCLVCEALIVPQLQPQASILLQGKILCVECGAGNPIHIKQCVICESRLPKAEMPAFSKEVPSTAPGHLRNTITCSKCGFINDWNAQICDWCEAKNNSSQTWQQSGSSFPTSRPNLLQRNEQGTQTIGLFYPSSKLLEKKECELVSQKKNKISDRSPLLTAISPGRGYWRKQLDHVCAHLRSYTQNNLEFRTLIGEPQMGTLISATVHKDDYEVSLQLNYALAINKDILTNKPETFHYHDLSLSNTEKDRLYESQVNMAKEVRVLNSRESQKNDYNKKVSRKGTSGGLQKIKTSKNNMVTKTMTLCVPKYEQNGDRITLRLQEKHNQKAIASHMELSLKK